MSKGLDPSWLAWLQENLARRCDPAELAGILADNGFSRAAIREAMGEASPDAARRDAIDHAALAANRLVRAADAAGAASLGGDRAQVYLIEDLLTPEQCDGLADLIRSALRASTVTTGAAAYRTSRTCDLGLLDDPQVALADRRIADLLGVPAAFSEPIQGQAYGPGQEFKAHTDYFAPGTAEYAEHCASQGNRTWTLMVYLNDTPAGGQTTFPRLDVAMSPKKGRALAWNNLLPDGSPNPFTLHEALPVEAGEKVVITKWFRERDILGAPARPAG
jgi:prolyl 4-hydroxylase